MKYLESKFVFIKSYLFILTFTFLAILLMLVNLVIIDLSGIELLERKVEEKSIWFFVSVLILAPLIETFVFQKLPIDFFRNSIKRDWPLVLISAIPFGLVHYIKDFFIRDVFYAFCFGSVFAYAYILAKKRDDLNAYLAVVLIHAGYNLFAVIIQSIVD